MIKFAQYNSETFEVLAAIDTAEYDIRYVSDSYAMVKISQEVYDQIKDKASWTNGTDFTHEPPPSPYHRLTSQGWQIDEASEAKAKALAKQNGKTAIDEAVAALYAPLVRFGAEYELRYNEALAFKEANYEGEAGEQVSSFAKAANKSNKEACDIILAQAAKIKSALSELGKARMQKFRLDALDDIEQIKSTSAEILATIKELALQLSEGKGD